ncbi:MAG TPA: cytochrome c1 [Rudaea sp.]|nr:cytochrome c1 [Rudaea sp.]
MKHRLGILLAVGLLAAGSVQAQEAEGLTPSNVRVENLASVQRGARIYFNYCSGCHSLKYMSYSRLSQDLKLTPDETLASFAFTGAKIGDQVMTNMPEAASAQWFGKTPPDLSLEARAKSPDWIYNYLKSFYLDPSRPSGWNNTVFPNVSMPNVLWELQGTQRAVLSEPKPGEEPKVEKLTLANPGKQSEAAFDDTARDITTFLAYAGEPAALVRESTGVWVILYLAFFTFLAWLLKHEFWKDVH